MAGRVTSAGSISLPLPIVPVPSKLRLLVHPSYLKHTMHISVFTHFSQVISRVQHWETIYS